MRAPDPPSSAQRRAAPRALLRAAAAALAATASAWAQTFASIPAAMERVPGNAGVSMPVRWSQGVMQVVVERRLWPAALVGPQITRLRLRRASFLDEGAYGPRRVRLRAAAGPTTQAASQLGVNLAANRPTGATEILALRDYDVPATPRPGRGAAVGVDLLDLQLDVPFQLSGTAMFFEWQTAGATFDVSPDHWIDMVSLPGADEGVSVPLGNGGCGNHSSGFPMVLEQVDGAPGFGRSVRYVVRNALPLAATVLIASIEPELRPPFGLGFGYDMGSAAPGCFLWAMGDFWVAGVTGAGGDVALTMPYPDLAWARGRRVGAQALSLDPPASIFSLSFSNGVLSTMNTTGIGRGAGTVLAFGASPVDSPWLPFIGSLPVVLFGY
jgi:hypothetical protein